MIKHILDWLPPLALAFLFLVSLPILSILPSSVAGYVLAGTVVLVILGYAAINRRLSLYAQRRNRGG